MEMFLRDNGREARDVVEPFHQSAGWRGKVLPWLGLLLRRDRGLEIREMQGPTSAFLELSLAI